MPFACVCTSTNVVRPYPSVHSAVLAAEFPYGSPAQLQRTDTGCISTGALVPFRPSLTTLWNSQVDPPRLREQGHIALAARPTPDGFASAR
jgi:hypothetical protein